MPIHLCLRSGWHIEGVCGNAAAGESGQGKGVTEERAHGGDGGRRCE